MVESDVPVAKERLVAADSGGNWNGRRSSHLVSSARSREPEVVSRCDGIRLCRPSVLRSVAVAENAQCEVQQQIVARLVEETVLERARGIARRVWLRHVAIDRRKQCPLKRIVVFKVCKAGERPGNARIGIISVSGARWAG